MLVERSPTHLASPDGEVGLGKPCGTWPRCGRA